MKERGNDSYLMEIEKCKMKGGDSRERGRILKSGCSNLRFALVKQSIHCQTRALEDTLPDNPCGQVDC